MSSIFFSHSSCSLQDIFLDDKPEVGVLLQGFGQAFLAFALTAMLLGPKMFIALVYTEQDQTAMTKEITSGPSNNVTSGRGSMTMSSRGSINPPSKDAASPSMTGEKGGAKAPMGARGSVGGSPGIGATNVPRFGTVAKPAEVKTTPKQNVRPSFIKGGVGSSSLTNKGSTPGSGVQPVSSPGVSPLALPAAAPQFPIGAIPPITGADDGARAGDLSAEGQSPQPSAPSAALAGPASPSIAEPQRAFTYPPLNRAASTSSVVDPVDPSTVSLHLRVAPGSPRLGAAPLSPRRAGSEVQLLTPLSPPGDSAMDFVKRLRSRLPANRAAVAGAAPTSSSSAVPMTQPAATTLVVNATASSSSSATQADAKEGGEQPGQPTA